jgi:hypothetical protein
LWQQGQLPDVNAFLARAGALNPPQLAAVLLVDLRQRWQGGERLGAEEHLRAYPALRQDPEAALDLIYGEYLLRQEHGETPNLSEFGQRFPEHAKNLRVQIELRQAVDAAGADTTAEGARNGAAAPAADWPIIPGYAVEGVLGRGGMGVVYKARQVGLNRLVALKLLRWGPDSSPEERTRFRAEAEAVARLQHPHVVQIHEVGEQDGRPFLALEFLQGGSLARRLDGTPRPAHEAAGLVQTLAGAVHAIHQLNIIHRDLKPDNVLLAADGTPKVADFGLAKLLDGDAGPTGSGDVLGTPPYMAPEQAQGQRQRIGPATDVYALGAVLYELLTGRPPFRAETPIDTLLQVIQDEPVSPSRLNPKLPRDLETICLKCLHKDLAKRYTSAAALAEDLDHFLAGRPVAARPVSAAGRAWRWGRRNPGWATALVSTAGLLLVIAVGSALAAVWFAEERSKARAAEKLATEERTVAEENLRRAEKAEGQAKEEAAIAGAVNDFLQQDLLGQANIGNQPLSSGGTERNRNITVSELLDRAAQGIEGKFAQQPLTEAAIRLTLGNTYYSLSRFAEAQPQLERSVQLRTAQLGADHSDTLDSKNQLAELYRAQAKYDRAEPLYQEVLVARVAQLGADHPKTLRSKHDLAGLYWNMGNYNRAEPLYREVLEGETAQLGPTHIDTLTCKHNLATLYQNQKKYDRAEPLYREALDGRAAQLGSDHPQTLVTKNNLAVLYMEQRKYDQAEPLYKEVLDTRIVKLGPVHLSTLASKNNLAILYQNQRKYDLVEPLLKEVLDGLTSQMGADHPHTLTTKYSLARLYKEQGKYEQAEPLYRDAAEGARQKLTIAHPNAQAFVRGLSDCYEEMGQPALGEPLLRELADYWKQKAGADSAQYAGQLASIGANLLRQQKPTDAEPVLRAGLAIRQKQEADEWTTFDTLSLLGEVLQAQRRYAEAEPLLLQGYEGLQQRQAKIPANSKSRLTEALERLVQFYGATGPKDKADEWRKKLEESKVAAQPPAKP